MLCSLVDANWIACSLGIDPSLLITLEGKITEGGKRKIVVVKRYVKKQEIKIRLVGRINVKCCAA